MLIFGVTGKARSGKDSVGQQLSVKHGFGRYALAKPLKMMLHVGLGLDPAEYETTEQKEAVIPRFGVSYRHLAQTLGTEWGRSINPELWLIIARLYVEQLVQEDKLPGIVITDIRFPNEASWIRSIGGRVVHVLRDNASSGLSEQAKAHSSEAGIRVMPEDAVLFNYGSLGDLQRAVDLLVLGGQA